MAELTKTQLKAAADRAGELSLADDDVALITSDAMPKGAGVRGAQLDTAGSEQHGPVYSFTRKQVDKALANFGPDKDTAASGTRRSGRRSAGNGRRRGGRARQADTETGSRDASADDDAGKGTEPARSEPARTGQPTQPSGTEPPKAEPNTST